MLLVGLTGGIGSGKSTVARLLAERGALVFEADEFARRSLDPGTPGYGKVVDRFGSEALESSGEIDRDWLARRVFADADARRDLEAIVHPEVGRRLAEALEPHRSSDRVVVYSVPLLVEAGLGPMFDVVVTVSASEDQRVARLATERGMSEETVRARMAAQVSDAERERAADVVIRNEGSPAELGRRVLELWSELEARRYHRAR